MNTFPTAAEARSGSRNNIAIHDEIRAIESDIYEAIAAGKMNVDVKNSPFTVTPAQDAPDSDINAYDYYGAIFSDTPGNSDVDLLYRSLKEQIDIVQQNFTSLGYQVQPLQNTDTGNTFFWRILW